MRDWTGSVFRTAGQDTFSAKWKDHAKGWRKTLGFATKTDANDFVADKRTEYRRRARGDWSEADEHARTPIAEHVEAFERFIAGRSRRRNDTRDDKHRKLTAARMRHAFEQMKVRNLRGLTLDACVDFLAGLLAGTATKPTGKGDSKPSSIATRNDYAQALRMFVAFCVRTERLLRSPIDEHTLPDLEAVDRKRRPALTAEQVALLVAAGPQRVLQRGPKATRVNQLVIAHRRALTVAIAFYTGLRNSELARLSWSWLDLRERVLTVPPTASKSGREELVPLHNALADLLTAIRCERAVERGRPVADSELVVGSMVNGTPKLPKNLPVRLRDDATFADLPTIDPTGGKLDLHAIRTSFANALDELGVPEGVVGELMRHKAQRVLAKHYLRRRIERLRDDLNELPSDVAKVPCLLAGRTDGPRNGPRTLMTVEAGRRAEPPPSFGATP